MKKLRRGSELETFLARGRERWRRFEELLERAERSPEWELGAQGLQELLSLYRQVASDLNRVRSLTANPELVGYLDQLAGRGYRFVYRGGGRSAMGPAVRRFFAEELPATFRREARAVWVAAAIFLFGAFFGFGIVMADRHAAEDLVPGQFFTESPRERVARIEREEERISNLEAALTFGSSLYIHNIKVSFLAFSLGALTLVGGAWILFYNGVILGAVAATYLLDGVEVFFLAWVGPHGALELPAIVFAGAAGLRAGWALYMPGEYSRAASLRRALPAVWRMLLGCCAILVVAGMIEGSFSQFSAKSVPYELKILLAAVLFVSLLGYLFFWRRRGR